MIKFIMVLALLTQVAKEPYFTKVEPLFERGSTKYTVRNDVQSHVSRTDESVHEINHFVCSRLDNIFEKKYRNSHSIYVLKDRNVIIAHPNITIGDVAQYVPDIIKDTAFNIYLVQERRWWDNSPIYLCEEASCYVVGTLAYDQEGKTNSTSFSAWKALELFGYCLVMSMVVEIEDPNYDSRQLDAYLYWNGEELNKIIRNHEKRGILRDKIRNWKNNLQKCTKLRNHCERKFGRNWCKRVLQ
jgi:hypothetical protein